MDDLILSIIVPVYNVEEYIRTCYESMFAKEVDSRIEIILVDDGSTDNSGEICEQVADSNNTRVFHKKNGGLASARNYGLKKARGKYVTFVDADDFINIKSLNQVLEYISCNTKDIVFLDIYKYYDDGKIVDIGNRIYKDEINGDSREEYIDYISSRPKFPASVCSKIYLKSFLDKYSIVFPSDNRISEDMGFSFECLLHASSYEIINIPFYYYRQNRENSITSFINMKSFNGLSQFIVDSIDMYSTNGQPRDIFIKKMFNYLAYEYSILLWMYSYIKGEEKREAYCFLKKYSFVMKWSLTGRNKVIKCIVDCFGIRVTSRLLYLFKKLVAK